jgi:hypothetical protein
MAIYHSHDLNSQINILENANVKNSYLNAFAQVCLMPRISGALEQDWVDGCKDVNCILSALRALMQSKYSDIILLCSVTIAFGMLLAVSAIG